MPSTFSPSLRIELIAPGEQAGTWGNTTNTNLGALFDSAIAGAASVSVISANQALTIADGAADQARTAVLQLTTTTGAPFSVYAPPVSKQYTVYNASAHAATIFNSTVTGNTTAAGTGVTIPAGRTMTLWTNGTNFRVQNDHVIGNVVGNASTATTLQTARLIGGVSFNGSADINLPGVNTTGNQNTTGSAATLTTTRTLWGQSFNGSANVTGTLSSVTTLAMSGQLTNTVATGTAPMVISSTTRVANLNVATAGNADTLTTARTINGVSFNGSANITVPVNTTQRSNNVAYQVPFVTAVTAGNQDLFTDSAANLTYNPSTNTLTTTTFVGALTGNVTGNLNGNLTAAAPTANTAAFGTNTTQVATTAFVQAALQALHPVGSVYINATNNANPATYFGFGTWTAFGAGRVPVGFDSGDANFNAAEKTGGAKDAIVVSHTHSFTGTTNTTGSHTHVQQYSGADGSNEGTHISGTAFSRPTAPSTASTQAAGDHSHTVSGTTASTGSSGTNANLQPYITVYMWKRTA